MMLTDFWDHVEADEALEGVGIDGMQTDRPGVIVKHRATGLTTRLPVEAIEKIEWSVIEDVLKGIREPLALQHMTRVVGYYSRVENWNKSKVGELHDRHRGNYAVAEAATL